MQKRPFRIGVAGPVGSGKTALVDRLSRALSPAYSLAVITNDIYTKEDAEFLIQQGTLPAERIRGVETGGCPHAAIREDASMNLEAIADLEESLPGLELIFVESGGDNLSAAFSPELVDVFIYVIDVAEGEKIPRKGGPGITRSDLLVINKIDLALAVGASLAVMERDSRRMRGDRPFVFTNLKDGTGLAFILTWIEHHLTVAPAQRRLILDAHSPYQGHPHRHTYENHRHHSSSTGTISRPFTEMRGIQGNTLYFDCFSGISGDMALGCLLDLGLDLEALHTELATLNLPAFHITAEGQTRGYLSGTHIHLQFPKQQTHRRLEDVRAILHASGLPEPVKTKSIHIFTLLAEAEGLVHGLPPEEVHFHEVGALDAIVDIVGVVVGLHLLGIEHVFASPLPLGSGWIEASHGMLPIPAPATLYLLARVNAPTLVDDTAAELVTPTGAALLAGLATFRRPALQLHRIGYGLGTRHLPHPNALRGWWGTLIAQGANQNPEGDVSSLLPSRSQKGRTVSAAPMGSAPLRFTDEGQVAWDQMWTDFCDLALAGGPPHRGTLLEPVMPAEVATDPEAYERVASEIERGWRLVTGLSTMRSATPGWVGLVCADEEMTLWLLRAVVVENVSVRREGTTLFLPAGPGFRLEEEIKNVITVVAKTYHYWKEHRKGQF